MRSSRPGREALNEMRRLLGVLRRARRGPRARLLSRRSSRLDALSGGESRDAGGRCSVEGDPPADPPGLDVAAYRVVQEALRAIRRAGGDHATVPVRYSRRGIELEVSGARPPTRTPRPRSG